MPFFPRRHGAMEAGFCFHGGVWSVSWYCKNVWQPGQERQGAGGWGWEVGEPLQGQAEAADAALATTMVRAEVNQGAPAATALEETERTAAAEVATAAASGVQTKGGASEPLCLSTCRRPPHASIPVMSSWPAVWMTVPYFSTPCRPPPARWPAGWYPGLLWLVRHKRADSSTQMSDLCAARREQNTLML